MGLYVSHGNVYAQLDTGEVYPVNVTAKNKLVRTEEVDSTSVEYLSKPVQLPADAIGATMGDLIRKFNLSEDHPIKFDEARHKETIGGTDDSGSSASTGSDNPPASKPRRGRPKVKKD